MCGAIIRTRRTPFSRATRYKSGDKAPDTLIKLGMSLAELGQKDAACSTFDELKTKYPRAPEHIGEEAKAWRTKAGC
jgi:TolA-binding protein